jgi:hypothetical protein
MAGIIQKTNPGGVSIHRNEFPRTFIWQAILKGAADIFFVLISPFSLSDCNAEAGIKPYCVSNQIEFTYQ